MLPRARQSPSLHADRADKFQASVELQRFWGYAGGAREQSLALISGLAAQVGSSGLVLEVLGGVCTRFAQGARPHDNAVACFHAALQGSTKVAHTLTCSCGCSAAMTPAFQSSSFPDDLTGCGQAHAPGLQDLQSGSGTTAMAETLHFRKPEHEI